MVNRRENKNFEACHEDVTARFTPSRQAVLEVVTASIRPIGAYTIIEEIGKVSDRPKPTTVYRALDFLQRHGFIHRIESLNAFVACTAGHTHVGSQFMICKTCGSVEEVHLHHLPESLRIKVDEIGFRLDNWNTEIHGVCRQCQV